MKTVKFIDILLIFLILFTSCKQDKLGISENETLKSKNNMIEIILQKQIKQGANQYIDEAGVEMPKSEFEMSELDATVYLGTKILTSNNFKFISDDEFRSKLVKIFGRIIDYKTEKEYLYVNYFDKCDRKFSLHPSNKLEYHGFNIIKNKKFITDFYYVPQLIDYQKDYPEIFKIEADVNTHFKDANQNNCSIELWKDFPNLPQQRKKNIQLLVARNKYLFNDSKADFVWLCFNDEQFLQILVKTFGYDDDEKLNKFVLDKNLKEDEEFEKVIWSKDCSGKIKFNLNIFETIKKASKDDQEKYLEALNNYIGYFIRTKENYLNLSFSEKAEISGKLAYYATKIVGQESHDYFKFFPFVASEEYQKEFEKQKYYTIKDFKTIYEETKTGGVWYPGMPE